MESIIRDNPIKRLSYSSNEKLIQKIKKNFLGDEKENFICLFYVYLNFDENLDFVIDLENVWKWLDFNQKIKSKIILEKFFVNEVDYKYDGEMILMTLHTFKNFCIKINSQKSIMTYNLLALLQYLLNETIEEEKQNVIGREYTDEMNIEQKEKINALQKSKLLRDLPERSVDKDQFSEARGGKLNNWYNIEFYNNDGITGALSEGDKPTFRNEMEENENDSKKKDKYAHALHKQETNFKPQTHEKCFDHHDYYWPYYHWPPRPRPYFDEYYDNLYFRGVEKSRDLENTKNASSLRDVSNNCWHSMRKNVNEIEVENIIFVVKNDNYFRKKKQVLYFI